AAGPAFPVARAAGARRGAAWATPGWGSSGARRGSAARAGRDTDPVAGVITHRQRPATAGGVVFLGVEDETGIANVMLTKGLWTKQRQVAMTARIVVVRGIVHNAEGAASITADLLEAVEPELSGTTALGSPSRDFR